jgi:hypothetical protein
MNITTKTVSELQGMKFFIPSYQRGYRWTRQEITDLLNDLEEFNDNQGIAKYCLQPLILKKRDDGTYEVVDGQQRLTTVFVFMRIAKEEIRSATPPFSLEYETRSKSTTFLDNLSEASERDDSNIDFYYISNARDTISGWLNAQSDKSLAITSINTKFRKHTQFIWYEIEPSTDPIDLFTKVNMGKIPLTNAELIKALFMNKENFSNMKEETINKRQIEIAMQWEQIEQIFHVKSFWEFLSAQPIQETRIDFVFDILANRYNEELKDKIPNVAGRYRTFLIFNQKFKEQKSPHSFVEEVWRDAERLVAVFKNWYDDLDIYHRIGWLIRANVKVDEIERETRKINKKEALVWLDMQIRNKLNVKRDEIDGNVENGELEYENKNCKKIRELLLLFNLVSLRGTENRFPFDRYMSEEWDIEHIHAIKDQLPKKDEDKRTYIEALEQEFKDKDYNGENSEVAKRLAEEISALLKTQNPDYSSFYESLKRKNEYSELLDEDNSIGNLALLNADINREYKNVTFFQKRKTLLEKTKEGRFIPTCTLNVFLKLYANEARDLYRWTDKDRKEYREAILKKLSGYLS